MPVVVRYAFGGRDYATVWSLLLTCSSITSFLVTPAWGMVYDLFGTYTPALITMPILLVVVLFLLSILFREKEA